MIFWFLISDGFALKIHIKKLEKKKVEERGVEVVSL